MIYSYQKDGSILGRNSDTQLGFVEGRIKTRLNDKGEKVKYSPFDELVNSGVEITPYVESVKTLEQLQQEALASINKIVIAECRSGLGKLYFSSLDSAARHTSELVQPDIEIRARAIQLLQWDVSIDAYCDTVLFNIEQGGEVSTLEAFIAGLPKL